MPDGTTIRVPTCLETDDSDTDYAVLYSDRPAQKLDWVGSGDEGYVETEVLNANRTRVRVTLTESDGIRNVSAHDPEDPDAQTTYEPADDQPESGTHWVPEEGDCEQIRILPVEVVEGMLADNDRRQIELTDDVHDLLLNYQRDDEDLSETLERVMALVPHPASLPRLTDPETVEEDNVVVVRAPDEDGRMSTVTYRTVGKIQTELNEAMGDD